MLKNRIAAAGIAVMTALSVAACGSEEEIDGTWDGEKSTLEVGDGRYTLTPKGTGRDINIEGEVDYENQEIIFSSNDAIDALSEDMPEGSIKELETHFGGRDQVDREKYTVDGDTLTLDGDEFTRTD